MNRSTQFDPAGPPGRRFDSEMITSDDESSRDSGICLMEVGSPTCFSSLQSNVVEHSYFAQKDENAMDIEETENVPVTRSPPKRKKRTTLRREKTCHVRLFDQSPTSHAMFARPTLTFRTDNHNRKRSLDSTGEYVSSKPEKREKASHASDHSHLESMESMDDDSQIDVEVKIRTVCSHQSTSTATGQAKFSWQRYHSTAIMQPVGETVEEREDMSHLVVKYHLETVSKFCSSTYGRISAETLCCLMQEGSEFDFNQKFILIDCRYPFEYEGGHIKNAINFYDRDKVSSLFFDENGRQRFNKIPIFYCEFSQKRGPSMASALREDDRKFNSEIYPNCSFEEMYVLDKGFRNFYQHASKACKEHLCEPFNYVEMLDPGHSGKLKKYTFHRRAAPGQTLLRMESQDSVINRTLQPSERPHTSSRPEASLENTDKTTPASRKEPVTYRRVLFQGITNSPTNFARGIPPNQLSPTTLSDAPIPLSFGDFT